MVKIHPAKKGKSVIIGKKNFKAKTTIDSKKTLGNIKLKSKLASRLGTKKEPNGQALIQRSGKTLKVTQPINDLRQLIKTKETPPAAKTKNAAPTNNQSATKKESVKKRLGLQSTSAKNRAKLASQIATANIQSNTGGVRQGIRGKNRSWQQNQPAQQQQQLQQQPQSILVPQVSVSTALTWPFLELYLISLLVQVPPMVMIAAPNVPSANAAPQTTGFSVIVSNLAPGVTQGEIFELFGEIGPVQSVQTINSSTSMVTFYNSAHAAQSIAEYNNRFLDGQPMLVTLIPAPSNPAGNVVRRAFREAFASSHWTFPSV